jgi:hypothetical protein
MKKLMRLLYAAFVYFCVATVISLTIGGYFFWSKGGLAGNRMSQFLIVLSGLDIYEFWKEIEGAARREPEETPPYEHLLEKRAQANLDLDLREVALQRAVGEIRLIEQQLRDQRSEFDQVRQAFDSELVRREKESTRQALQQLQETMQALSPKQAKEQILMWLENPGRDYPFPERNVNNDVVQLIQGMAGDRQAKLFKEFKGDKEKKILNDLLDQIRRGNQEDLLRDAKEKLDQASYVRPDNEARTE